MKNLLFAVLTIAFALPAPVPAEGKSATITTEQVKRGAAVYEEFCQKCHGDKLNNGEFGAPIKGKFFRDLWTDKTLGVLFTQTTKTMPPDDPGFLTNQEYADVLAYILAENGLEPGGGALPADPQALRSVPLPWAE